jgi:hypothetical protein
MRLVFTACKAGIILLLTCSLFYACSNSAKVGKIQHTVMFSLRHELDAPETMKFLKDAQRILSAIPVVENFQVKQQVSPKNEFNFFFFLEFADRNAYQTYNDHPDHVKFVIERWNTEVTKFLEADFELLDK